MQNLDIHFAHLEVVNISLIKLEHKIGRLVPGVTNSSQSHTSL